MLLDEQLKEIETKTLPVWIETALTTFKNCLTHEKTRIEAIRNRESLSTYSHGRKHRLITNAEINKALKAFETDTASGFIRDERPTTIIEEEFTEEDEAWITQMFDIIRKYIGTPWKIIYEAAIAAARQSIEEIPRSEPEGNGYSKIYMNLLSNHSNSDEELQKIINSRTTVMRVFRENLTNAIVEEECIHLHIQISTILTCIETNDHPHTETYSTILDQLRAAKASIEQSLQLSETSPGTDSNDSLPPIDKEKIERRALIIQSTYAFLEAIEYTKKKKIEELVAEINMTFDQEIWFPIAKLTLINALHENEKRAGDYQDKCIATIQNELALVQFREEAKALIEAKNAVIPLIEQFKKEEEECSTACQLLEAYKTVNHLNINALKKCLQAEHQQLLEIQNQILELQQQVEGNLLALEKSINDAISNNILIHFSADELHSKILNSPKNRRSLLAQLLEIKAVHDAIERRIKENSTVLLKSTTPITALLPQLAMGEPIIDNHFKRVLAALEQLETYGKTLSESKRWGGKEDKDAVAKGRKVLEIANELTIQVLNAQLNPTVITDSHNVFKTKFITTLHQYDKLMDQHRALWKPIVANILIALSGLGALIILYRLTAYACSNHKSHSLGKEVGFFMKTATHKKIETINNAIEKELRDRQEQRDHFTATSSSTRHGSD